MELLPTLCTLRCAMMQTQLLHCRDADLELEVTQDAPQKNMASAGSVIIPMTTFVLANLACMTGNFISCHATVHARLLLLKSGDMHQFIPHALTSLDTYVCQELGLGQAVTSGKKSGRKMASGENHHDGVIVDLPSHIAIHSSSCQAISILHTKASTKNASRFRKACQALELCRCTSLRHTWCKGSRSPHGKTQDCPWALPFQVSGLCSGRRPHHLLAQAATHKHRARQGART